MTFSWYEPIAKLEYWNVDNWVKYNVKGINQLILRVHYDQLFIVADSKILETINMTCKLKGIHKGNVLILMVAGNKEVRKIKFQIISDAIQCFKRLGYFFPVINYNSKQNIKIKPKLSKLEDVLKQTLNNNDTLTSSSPSPVYENFVKTCLLDPMFVQTVRETEHILNVINKPKNS